MSANCPSCRGEKTVQGVWCYVYRAIDRDGNLVDTMLSDERDLLSAKAFFKQAIATVGHKPERVTTDKHASYRRAVHRVLGRKGSVRNQNVVRTIGESLSSGSFTPRGLGGLPDSRQVGPALAKSLPLLR